MRLNSRLTPVRRRLRLSTQLPMPTVAGRRTLPDTFAARHEPPVVRQAVESHAGRWVATSAGSLLAVVEPTTSIGASSPPWLLLAATVVGLPALLWTYKCAMMIMFQRSIIYMGAWPPGARTLKVDPSDPLLRDLDVLDVAIPGGDLDIILRGVELRRRARIDKTSASATANEAPTVVVYFQGNMGSPVARIPLFAHLLTSTLSPFSNGRTTLLAITPRSYYLSTNAKATQSGLLRDYRAILQHAQTAYPGHRLVIYGHSLGGTAACCLLGGDQGMPSGDSRELVAPISPPHALVLENAFPSVPLMIERSLYRSKWLPYHFLSPFVRDRWDALDALRRSDGALRQTPILFVSGVDDSLVLPELVREMHEAAAAKDGHASRRWLSISQASHDDTWARKGPWGRGVRGFLDEVGRNAARN